jgi:hypothetical protein
MTPTPATAETCEACLAPFEDGRHVWMKEMPDLVSHAQKLHTLLVAKDAEIARLRAALESAGGYACRRCDFTCPPHPRGTNWLLMMHGHETEPRAALKGEGKA